MPAPTVPAAIARAVAYGPEVIPLAQGRGRVGAVLRTALYLEGDGGEIAGVVGAPGVDGPLSLRVESLDRLLALPGLRPGVPFAGSGDGLWIGGLARIDLRRATPWNPSPPRLAAAAPALRNAAAALEQEILARAAGEGFAPLAAALARIARGEVLQEKLGSEGDPLRRMALDGASELAEGLRLSDSRRAGSAMIGLLGLGPGLTPSGDDFTCGVLASARWLNGGQGGAALLSGEAAAVAAVAPGRTTRLGARLVAQAAAGLVYQPAMELGAAVLGGRAGEVAAAARWLFELGHTSGADLACGIMFGVILCGGQSSPREE